MTDSQVKYQTMMENRRHNLEMERVAQSELGVKQQEADTRARQVDVSEMQATASLQQAAASQKQANVAEQKHWWDVGWHFASFLFPDANTALKSGAQIVSSLFS